MRIAILVGLAILLVLAVVGVVRQFLQAATAAHAEGGIVGLGPQYFFWLDVLYLVILLLLAILYLASSTGLRELVPPIVAGVLPIGVPWFGAIGAVLVGLQGVFEHANQDTARHPEPPLGIVVQLLASRPPPVRCRIGHDRVLHVRLAERGLGIASQVHFNPKRLGRHGRPGLFRLRLPDRVP